jgi:hypothetical protein
VVDDDDTLGDGRHVVHVVAGEEHGGAVALVIGADEVAHGGLHGHVEADGRLVEEQDLGPVDEGRRQLALHTLAHGELPRGRVDEPRQIQQRDQLVDGGLELRPRHLVDGAVELEGLGGRQVPDELLLLARHQHDRRQERHVARARHVAEDLDRPRVGCSRPESILSVVVLPAPLGPRKPTRAPCSMRLRAAARQPPKRQQPLRCKGRRAAGADAATTERRPHRVMPSGGTRDRKATRARRCPTQRSRPWVRASKVGNPRGSARNLQAKPSRVQPPKERRCRRRTLVLLLQNDTSTDPKERRARSSCRRRPRSAGGSSARSRTRGGCSPSPR